MYLIHWPDISSEFVLCDPNVQVLRMPSSCAHPISVPLPYKQPRSGGNRIPHYDIDIVIKREPLPDDVDPENYRELPTAAITLGRDEVKVMKIESLTQRMMSPTEVITVWDTEVPVKDSTEKVGSHAMYFTG